MEPNSISLSWLRDLPSLDLVHLDGLSYDEKIHVLDDIGKIFLRIMADLDVKWKPRPVDQQLRREIINWMKSELEPHVGPINKKLILAMDVSVDYAERVYEGGDFKTKLAITKHLVIIVYLDDAVMQDINIENEAASLLIKLFSGQQFDNPYLRELIKTSYGLSDSISDPVAGNIILQSTAAAIDACVLESRNIRDGGKYLKICEAEEERGKDIADYELAKKGFRIPLPFDADRAKVGGHLLAHGWPAWMREKSGFCEVFAVVSFSITPGGVDIPTRLWLAALPEMRHFIMYINDIFSFPKEFLADDEVASVMVITKERRRIGMPGTAPDGGWCLRDTIEEIYVKIISAAARINRLLRPVPEARYNADGSVRSITELVVLLKDGGETNVNEEDIMKALSMASWEMHQRGYVLFHFDTPRYRIYEIFGWAREMMGTRAVETEWWSSYF